MKKKLRLLYSLFLILVTTTSILSYTETKEEKSERLQWFKDAKLGIFIHWGIYAVNGIDESWSFFNGYISYQDYMGQLKKFHAEKYNPAKWASLIKKSGAKYSVITSKHHDGVALWKSMSGHLNVVKKTAAGRDLIAPFCKALREKKIKVGLYYSLIDWSHPNYPNFLKGKNRYQEDPTRWKSFIKFNFRQIEELFILFKPDLIWFDGDWEQSAERWKAKELREAIFTWQPKVIINSRLQGYGDYETPEQGLPITKPKSQYWELCLTMNDSWGYQENDRNYKSTSQIIRIFIDCIHNGGNLLLDIGPKADGTIPAEQVNILKGLGRWTKKHEEAIYGSRAGLPSGHFHGPTTLSKDKKTLYLFTAHRPKDFLVLKGINNAINRIRVVGNGTKLRYKTYGKQYWSKYPGIIYIDVPENVLDEDVTVIAVQLKGEISLFREEN